MKKRNVCLDRCCVSLLSGQKPLEGLTVLRHTKSILVSRPALSHLSDWSGCPTAHLPLTPSSVEINRWICCFELLVGCVARQRHMVRDHFKWKILEIKGLSDLPKLSLRWFLLASWQREWSQNYCALHVTVRVWWQLDLIYVSPALYKQRPV